MGEVWKYCDIYREFPILSDGAKRIGVVRHFMKVGKLEPVKK